MDLENISIGELQSCKTLLQGFVAEGAVKISEVITAIDSRLSGFVSDPHPATKLRSSRITNCSVCGGPAVKLPVNTGAGNAIGRKYAYAIQCQTRPGKDMPWLPTHCGHTEYILHGDL